MATFGNISDWLLVALGGAMGAVSRYGISLLPWFASDKFYATLTANLSGCLLIGVLYAVMQHFGMNKDVWLIAVTGFLGGYTTFSSFSLDSMQLLQAGRIGIGLTYVVISVVGGLAACALGIRLCSKLLRL